MTITRINPQTLHATPGYHHVTIVEAGRLAYIAGQCPLDRAGNVPPGLDTQVDQVVENSREALAAAGAEPDDVVRSVIYVMTDDRSELSQVWDRLKASDLAPAFTTASTLLGVAQLGYPGQRIEVDLTAALPS